MRLQMIFESEEKRIPFKMRLPEDLMQIYGIIKNYGELYVVGGAVRDELLKKVPKDYDLATDLTPDEILAIFGVDLKTYEPGKPVHANGYKLDLTGKQFGVIRIWTAEGNEYEIATFREDVSAGRNPEVRWATIEDDVLRRDLTINALFYDIDSGEIVDLVGGVEDIKNGIVRAVGDPAERFAEDSLRVMRAIRFAARMGSNLDPKTSQGVKTAASASTLKGSSPERIQEEFIKGLETAQSPAQYVGLAINHNLMKHILPGLQITNTLEPAPLASQIAALTVQNDPNEVFKALKSMSFSNSIRDKVTLLLRLSTVSPEDAPRLKKEAQRIRLTDDEIRAFTDMSGVLSRTTSDAFMRFIKDSPAVTARELMDKGLRGPEIGQAMRKADMKRFMSYIGEAMTRRLTAFLD